MLKKQFTYTFFCDIMFFIDVKAIYEFMLWVYKLHLLNRAIMENSNESI